MEHIIFTCWITKRIRIRHTWKMCGALFVRACWLGYFNFEIRQFVVFAMFSLSIHHDAFFARLFRHCSVFFRVCFCRKEEIELVFNEMKRQRVKICLPFYVCVLCSVYSFMSAKRSQFHIILHFIILFIICYYSTWNGKWLAHSMNKTHT